MNENTTAHQNDAANTVRTVRTTRKPPADDRDPVSPLVFNTIMVTSGVSVGLFICTVIHTVYLAVTGAA